MSEWTRAVGRTEERGAHGSGLERVVRLEREPGGTGRHRHLQPLGRRGTDKR